jgi:hypothetical protein
MAATLRTVISPGRYLQGKGSLSLFQFDQPVMMRV